MRLILDRVQGHEIDSGIGVGRISRMALIIVNAGELPLTPDPTMLIQALAIQGMPQKGARFPHDDYKDYFVKRHNIRALSALHYDVEIIYESHTLLTVRDTSSLSMVRTQLHPKDFSPLYVQWKAPGNAGNPLIKKLANATMPLPLRHLIVSKTIDHQASDAIIASYPSVNLNVWQGLAPGYWMFSDIDGYTDDEGTTYTYTAVFTTKMIEDWSQIEFLEDDRGQAVPVPEADVKGLRSKAYSWGIDSSVNGVLKVGMLPQVDFYQLFGI